MRRLFLFLATTFCFVFLSTYIYAQPCAVLTFTGPPGSTIPCDSDLNISASVSFPLGLNNTDTYTGGVIPFTPYPFVGPNSILANIDDVWSAPISLTFPFCFFGQIYYSIVIGSNGQISFDTVGTQPPLTPGSCLWASSGWIAPTSNIAMNNTIMSPYHDLLPLNTTNVTTWGIYGIPPCRKMVVNWTNMPMFSCTTLIDTQQIVLHELTNFIDINIKNKPLCTGWNGGVAHEGIQNATGTIAFMVPGRNGTQWTAQDDAYRFEPAGAPTTISSYTFTWKDSATGTILGTGPLLTLPAPVTLTEVTCDVSVVGGCVPYTFSNKYTIGVAKVNAGFTYEKHYGCEEDTIVFTNTTSPSSGTTYTWFFGDLGTSTDANPVHIYANPGSYTVRLIANHPPCLLDTIDIVVNISHPIDAVFDVTRDPLPAGMPKDSICLGENIKVTSASQPSPALLAHDWSWGDGTPNDIGPTSSHVYADPGTYTIRLIITDTLGCKDTSYHDVYVDNPPFEAFTISDSVICVGEPVFFTDTLAPLVQWFEWDFGDKRLKDVHNPSHSWDQAATYTVWLIGHYRICPNDSVSKTIEVDDYPNVSLGADTMICPGITGSILLANINNTGSLNNLWSTGETSNAITVSEPGIYWLTVASPNQECKTSDSIWVKRDCYLNIPNSFSPNGDGLNDYFLPRELLSSGLRSFTMNIYNRWGENIFTTNSIEGRGWDGKYNSLDQPLGTYIYIINAQFMNNVRKEFKGNVTLLR